MKKQASHTYAVEVMIDRKRIDIDVVATNRASAAAKVRKMGYEVRAVNMLD
jgi:hypothetical protein